MALRPWLFLLALLPIALAVPTTTVGSGPSPYPGNGESVYLGCFSEPHVADLRLARRSDEAMTAELCVAHCLEKGYAFASVGDRRNCHCQAHFGLSIEVNEGECLAPCDGDSSQSCGGEKTFNRYGPPSLLKRNDPFTTIKWLTTSTTSPRIAFTSVVTETQTKTQTISSTCAKSTTTLLLTETQTKVLSVCPTATRTNTVTVYPTNTQTRTTTASCSKATVTLVSIATGSCSKSTGIVTVSSCTKTVTSAPVLSTLTSTKTLTATCSNTTVISISKVAGTCSTGILTVSSCTKTATSTFTTSVSKSVITSTVTLPGSTATSVATVTVTTGPSLPTCTPPILLNGGFESGLDSWSVSDAYITAEESQSDDVEQYLYPHSGDLMLSVYRYADNTNQLQTVEQQVTLCAGALYHARAYVTQGLLNENPYTFQICLDTSCGLLITPPDTDGQTGWVTYDTDFIAQSNSTTFIMAFTNFNPAQNIFVDDVSLELA